MNTGGLHKPTMEDVALAAGVHRTTVSLALRDHPRIPVATRQRIKAAAKKLGYRPDPLLSILMSSRVCRHKAIWRGTLAVLTTGPDAKTWQQSTAHIAMFDGARNRAKELGWDLQTFWAEDPSLPIRRLSKILQVRNIPGCMVMPVIGRRDIFDGMQWDAFSAVTIGYSLQTPEMHRVSNDYYHSMILTMEHCRRLGFRRLGLALDQTTDSKVDHLWLAAYLIEQRFYRELADMEPLLLSPDADASTLIGQWMEREKPEVIISLPHSSVRLHIQRLTSLAARKLRWVSLGCYELGEPDSGVYQNYPLIGETAVGYLVNMVQHGERGIPSQGHTLLIKSQWNVGTTLGQAPRRTRVTRTRS